VTPARALHSGWVNLDVVGHFNFLMSTQLNLRWNFDDDNWRLEGGTKVFIQADLVTGVVSKNKCGNPRNQNENVTRDSRLRYAEKFRKNDNDCQAPHEGRERCFSFKTDKNVTFFRVHPNITIGFSLNTRQ